MEIPKSLDPPSDLPPLRIHHFLTWMAVAALSFAMVHMASKRLGFEMTDVPIKLFLPLLFQTLAATVLGFSVYWYRHRHRLLEEPGQGLLLLIGLQFFWEMATAILFALFPILHTEAHLGPAKGFTLGLVS